jgi:hypothetical protein
VGRGDVKEGRVRGRRIGSASQEYRTNYISQFFCYLGKSFFILFYSILFYFILRGIEGFFFKCLEPGAWDGLHERCPRLEATHS